MLTTAPVISLLPITDKDAARAFYSEVLGLEFVADDGFALVYRSGDRWLRLTPVHGPFAPQPFSVIGWEVSDIVTTVRGLKERGVAFLRYPMFEQDEDDVWRAPHDGTGVAWFNDPDGNLLSVVEPS